MITSGGMVMSMDYHGGSKREIFAKRSYDPYILGILENSLFLEHRFTSDIIEVELINITQSKLKIPAIETDGMDRVLFIDKSRQPEGKIQTGNAGFEVAVRHRLVTTNFSLDNFLYSIVQKGMK